MSKHTPGPWKVMDLRDDEEYRLRLGKIQIQSDNVAICDIQFNSFFSNEWIKESEANARLIAAAPELLEVCRDALDFAKLASGADLSPIINKLKKAIRKAEGK